MRPAQLRASFEQYVATARPAADERTPQTLDEVRLCP